MKKFIELKIKEVKVKDSTFFKLNKPKINDDPSVLLDLGFDLNFQLMDDGFLIDYYGKQYRYYYTQKLEDTTFLEKMVNDINHTYSDIFSKPKTKKLFSLDYEYNEKEKTYRLLDLRINKDKYYRILKNMGYAIMFSYNYEYNHTIFIFEYDDNEYVLYNKLYTQEEFEILKSKFEAIIDKYNKLKNKDIKTIHFEV